MSKLVKKHARKFDFLRVSGYALAAVSAVTSTIGLQTIIASNIGNGTAIQLGLSWTIAIVACFLIQSLVVAGFLGLVSGADIGRRMWGYFLIWFIAAFISVSTAFGSWWYTVASPGFENRVTEESLLNVRNPVMIATEKFLTAQQSFNIVERRAKQMETVELETGRSCGYSAGIGRGPRSALRVGQASAASTHSESLDALTIQLRASLDGFSTLTDEAIKTSYKGAQTALSDGLLIEAKLWLMEQKRGFETGFKSDRGLQFACEDSQMLIAISTALTAFENVPNLPAEIPTVEEVTLSEAVMGSYGRIAFPILKAIEFAPTGAAAPIASDYAALIPPLLVESFMALLLWLSAPRGGGAGIVGPDLRAKLNREPDPVFLAVYEALRTPNPATRAYERQHTLLLQLCKIDAIFLTLPSRGTLWRRHALELLALLTLMARTPEEYHALRPIYLHLPLDDMPPYFQGRTKWHSEETFDLYQIPRTLYDRLHHEMIVNLIGARMRDNDSVEKVLEKV